MEPKSSSFAFPCRELCRVVSLFYCVSICASMTCSSASTTPDSITKKTTSICYGNTLPKRARQRTSRFELLANTARFPFLNNQHEITYRSLESSGVTPMKYPIICPLFIQSTKNWSFRRKQKKFTSLLVCFAPHTRSVVYSLSLHCICFICIFRIKLNCFQFSLNST